MVKVNPIRSEEDHDAALTRLSEIFQAEIGTPEGDERDILVDLIERYEEKHYPIGPPTDPIAAATATASATAPPTRSRTIGKTPDSLRTCGPLLLT